MKREKIYQFFFKLRNIISKLEIENKEITDPNKIKNEINRFFTNLLAKPLQKSLPLRE